MSDDPLLSLSQARARVPGRGNGPLAISTLTRWILKGCPSRDGRRVRLAATRAGGRWLVRESALDEFFAALGADPEDATPTPRSQNARRKAADAAGRELERRGC
jgi:hypothetical protein